jgi:hypothetical protein
MASEAEVQPVETTWLIAELVLHRNLAGEHPHERGHDAVRADARAPSR